ncbi:MAG: NUMOD3 domain-containing DNA-binding protein [archaeon]
MLGRRHSEETKKKLSLVHKGKIIKEETRNKISKALKGRACTKERKQKLKDYYKTHNNHFKGKKHTLETRRKMSLAHMGKAPWNKGENWSGETKKKISDKLKGIKLTSETRKKMSLAHKGKTLSDITKKKISTFRKGRKMTLEHKNKMLESLNRSPNKFEKKYIDLFKQNNLPLEFVGGFYDRRFFIAGRVPDFVSTNGKKVIVEVFYDYFKIKQYGSVENYKKERIDTFSKYGWKTLFFTYKELESNFDECLEIIREELK